MNNSIITTLTPAELQALIQSGIVDAIEQLQSTAQPQPDEVIYLTRKETAKRLSVSLVTLYNWDRKGILKAHKVGTRVRYNLSDINAFAEDRK
jgi:excisionase family DNA binding protein